MKQPKQPKQLKQLKQLKQSKTVENKNKLNKNKIITIEKNREEQMYLMNQRIRERYRIFLEEN
ncbi:hypothetical protein [Methanolapillus africanus]|uniref:hypothetical protein n=1 Tax=Methanolapillus africanus TaxID=3028297 RepID=UPI0030B91167